MSKQKNAASRSILGGIFLLIAALGCAYAFVPGAAKAFDALRGKQPERSYPNALDNIQRLEGWLPHWTNQRTLALNAAKEGFTDLLFFNGSISEAGECSLESESRLSSAIAALEGKPVRKWLTVTNHGRSLAAALDPANRSKHIID